MIFDYAILSDKGPRAENEDAAGYWPLGDDGFALAVADGLGGHSGGRLASEIAIKLFSEALLASSSDLERVARSIHAAIRIKQKDDLAVRGMATTLTAAVAKGEILQIVHCGDTRLILQRGKGIKKITADHTEAQRFLTLGKITRDEYRAYPRKNVLESALGIPSDPQIDLHEIAIRPLDRIIITSDGVHGKVFLRELNDLLAAAPDAASFVQSVADMVKTRGPVDNYTVGAVFCAAS